MRGRYQQKWRRMFRQRHADARRFVERACTIIKPDPKSSLIHFAVRAAETDRRTVAVTATTDVIRKSLALLIPSFFFALTSEHVASAVAVHRWSVLNALGALVMTDVLLYAVVPSAWLSKACQDSWGIESLLSTWPIAAVGTYIWAAVKFRDAQPYWAIVLTVVLVKLALSAMLTVLKRRLHRRARARYPLAVVLDELLALTAMARSAGHQWSDLPFRGRLARRAQALADHIGATWHEGMGLPRDKAIRHSQTAAACLRSFLAGVTAAVTHAHKLDSEILAQQFAALASGIVSARWEQLAIPSPIESTETPHSIAETVTSVVTALLPIGVVLLARWARLPVPALPESYLVFGAALWAIAGLLSTFDERFEGRIRALRSVLSIVSAPPAGRDVD